MDSVTQAKRFGLESLNQLSLAVRSSSTNSTCAAESILPFSLGRNRRSRTYIPQVGRAIWRELLTHCWRAKRIGRNAKQVDDLVLKVG